MRKIDKSQQLSTVYKAWENGLEANNTAHPSYNSSKGEYYKKDIVMDALRCQNGLCAYTEIQLCSLQYLTAENWENGRYKGEIEGRVHNGQLEHFDERLKYKDKEKEKKESKNTKKDPKVKEAIESKNGENIIYQHKDWLWANFFMIDSDTNNLKGVKAVDYILKPDSDDYDPFRLFDYSQFTHEYIPNSELSGEEKIRVNNMIDILGLNFPNVIFKRRQVVERIIKYPLEEHVEIQFPTAVEFYKKSQNTEGY